MFVYLFRGTMYVLPIVYAETSGDLYSATLTPVTVTYDVDGDQIVTAQGYFHDTSDSLGALPDNDDSYRFGVVVCPD